ncbi:hypothetical protein A2U01_0034920, partial [Trifolium medium]|nr:hypothetical protein [Trifolium medium]
MVLCLFHWLTALVGGSVFVLGLRQFYSVFYVLCVFVLDPRVGRFCWRGFVGSGYSGEGLSWGGDDADLEVLSGFGAASMVVRFDGVVVVVGGVEARWWLEAMRWCCGGE